VGEIRAANEKTIRDKVCSNILARFFICHFWASISPWWELFAGEIGTQNERITKVKVNS